MTPVSVCGGHKFAYHPWTGRKLAHGEEGSSHAPAHIHIHTWPGRLQGQALSQGLSLAPPPGLHAWPRHRPSQPRRGQVELAVPRPGMEREDHLQRKD